MRIGASTSCFYPLETEKALKKVTELGFERAEVFFNSYSELQEGFVKKLSAVVEGSETKIISVHPFSSFLESNCIFTEYQRRFEDFIEIYRQTCHAAAVLGAKYVVIHGALEKPKIHIPDERYFERFSLLCEIGKREGVAVCQENVNRFKSQRIEFCKKMRVALGDDFHLVFDVKQALRAGEDPFAFLEEFKNDIVHLHISDNGSSGDCLPPGKGSFDFKKLKNIMDGANYNGDAVIEIYSLNYNVEKELKESKEFLKALWQM